MNSPVKIVCVPPAEFGSAWKVAGATLLRGMLAAEMPVLETMDRIRDGSCQFWLITEPNPARLRGCFVTEVMEDDGEWFVWVSALAGEGIQQWGKAISDRMAKFAADEECSAVRFAGSKALARVYGKCRVVGQVRQGVAILERAVQ